MNVEYLLLFLILSGIIMYFSKKKYISIVCIVIAIVFTTIFYSIVHVDKLGRFLLNTGVASVTRETVADTDVDGVFTLCVDTSAMSEEQFVFTDNYSYDDLKKWFDKYSNNRVMLKIRSGSKIVYFEDLGMSRNLEINDVITRYNSFKDTGKLPINHVRYRFLCFYLSRNY